MENLNETINKALRLMIYDKSKTLLENQILLKESDDDEIIAYLDYYLKSKSCGDIANDMESMKSNPAYTQLSKKEKDDYDNAIFGLRNPGWATAPIVGPVKCSGSDKCQCVKDYMKRKFLEQLNSDKKRDVIVQVCGFTTKFPPQTPIKACQTNSVTTTTTTSSQNNQNVNNQVITTTTTSQLQTQVDVNNLDSKIGGQKKYLSLDDLLGNNSSTPPEYQVQNKGQELNQQQQQNYLWGTGGDINNPPTIGGEVPAEIRGMNTRLSQPTQNTPTQTGQNQTTTNPNQQTTQTGQNQTTSNPTQQTNITFNYRYPGDRRYRYGVKDNKWFAKNIKNNKIFDLSSNQKFQSSVDRLNSQFPNAIKK